MSADRLPRNVATDEVARLQPASGDSALSA